MRIHAIFLFIFGLIFMVATAACPGGNKDIPVEESEDPPPENINGIDLPVEVRIGNPEISGGPRNLWVFHQYGTDVIEYLVAWEELGQDSKEMTVWLMGDREGQYKEVDVWHISQFKNGETAVFNVEMEQGVWLFQAFGGIGTVILELAIYNAEDELIAEYSALDNYPLTTINLLEPGIIKFEVIPAELVDGYEDAYYGWYYN